MTEVQTADPGADFAALMSGAAEQAGAEQRPHWLNEDGSARYGTNPDGSPKKAKGRPRKSPSLDELKEQKDGQEPPAGSPGDRPPDEKAGKGKGKGRDRQPPPPMPREGYIAKGVNKLYRKAGRIVRAMDHDIGTAIIEITKKDVLEDGTPDPDDTTVGEAWEELCRVNPRIRRFVLFCLRGGAWGQLVMAHAPVLLAILMKESVYKHIPLAKLLQAFFSGDEDDQEPGGETPPPPFVPGTAERVAEEPPASRGNGSGPPLKGLLAGLTEDDLSQMAGMVDKMMPGLGGSRRSTGTPRARPAGVPEGGASPPAA